MTEMFLVHSPGLYTSIQERGRFGYIHMGVPISGALDEFACICANLLEGNPEHRAGLAITLAGSPRTAPATGSVFTVGG